MVTIEDVARKAGVSKAAVSSVLSGKSSSIRVSEETRRRILALAREMRYRPNHIARSLATQRTDMVGILVDSLEMPSTISILNSAQSALNRYGIRALFGNFHRNGDELARYVDEFAHMGVEALLIISYYDIESSENARERLKSTGVPLVVAGRSLHSLAAHYIAPDRVQGVYEAVRYMVDSGLRRVALMLRGSKEDDERLKGRLEGYKRALSDAGIEFDSALVFENLGHDEAVYKFARNGFPTMARRPQGLITTDDRMALALVKGFLEANLVPNRDIAVIGYGNLPITRYVPFPLNTIDHPTEQIGQMAGDLVFRLVEARREGRQLPPSQILVPMRLVIRDPIAQIPREDQ